MAYQSVRLTNTSHDTDGTNTVTNNILLLDRSIYQRLGSLIACKTILDDYNNDRLPYTFKQFLDNLDTIGTAEATEDIIALDNYLGSLGITEVYPYSKDVMDIPQWLTLQGSSANRNVIYENYNIIDGSDNIIYTK